VVRKSPDRPDLAKDVRLIVGYGNEAIHPVKRRKLKPVPPSRTHAKDCRERAFGVAGRLYAE